MLKLPESALAKNQFKHLYYGANYSTYVIVRWDDDLNNGHNTFSIVLSKGSFWPKFILTKKPFLSELVPYQGITSDGPTHYVHGVIYSMKNKKYDAAREIAIWPEVSDEYLLHCYNQGKVREVLEHRLPSLMYSFKEKLERLFPEFTY